MKRREINMYDDFKAEIKKDNWLEKHSWASLGSYIKKIDPKLGMLIDNISPSDDFSFYLARYPYGALIVDKGVFQLLNSDKHLVPLNHSSVPNNIKYDLGYNKLIPTGLITRNSIETFFIAKNYTVPASLYGVGDIVALWHVLEGDNTYQVGPIWNISSGARTIYMLPKITDKNCYRALKIKYGCSLPILSLRDHWQIFTYLANHQAFPDENEWFSEIIFFSRKWFEKKEDENFAPLFRYLFENVWYSSSFRRNQFIFDFAFSLAQENRNLKPNPYLADTVRHLIAMGEGSVPGLAAAIDDTSAPIAGLQKIFIEDYGLKKYAPVIMHMHHFSMNKNRPVYYSLEAPTTTIFSPRSNRLSSKMVDIRELKHITEVLFSEILKGTLYIEKTPLFWLAQNVSYKFYHSEKDQFNEILSILDLPKIDNFFTKTLVDSKKYIFPEFSPLFRGCISVSRTI